MAPLHIDRVISLGGLCEVAFQIRRFVRSDKAYPFDWWITPFASVPKVLEGGLRHVFEPQHLVKVPDYDGRSALYSAFSGTIHLHEFLHGENLLAYDPEEIARRLGPKYAFLQSRLIEECASGTTLFIRQHLPRDPDDPDELRRLVLRTCDAIEAICPSYRLVLVDYEPEMELPETVLRRRAVRYADCNDLGSKRGWAEMFAGLPFSFRRRHRKLDIADLLATFPPRRTLLQRLTGRSGSSRRR